MKQVDTILSCSCVDAILLRKHAYTEILWCSSLGGSKESRISKFVTGKTKHRPPNFEQQSSSITVAVGPGSSCKSPMRSICVHRDSRRTAVVLEAGRCSRMSHGGQPSGFLLMVVTPWTRSALPPAEPVMRSASWNCPAPVVAEIDQNNPPRSSRLHGAGGRLFFFIFLLRSASAAPPRSRVWLPPRRRLRRHARPLPRRRLGLPAEWPRRHPRHMRGIAVSARPKPPWRRAERRRAITPAAASSRPSRPPPCGPSSASPSTDAPLLHCSHRHAATRRRRHAKPPGRAAALGRHPVAARHLRSSSLAREDKRGTRESRKR